MDSACILLSPAFSVGLLASHPSVSDRGGGGLLFPLPLRRQHRASASSSFMPAPFHSSARSCYKKRNNLEFDSLLGA